MTRFDPRWRMSIHSQTRMRAQFGEELCTTVFSEVVAAAEAPARGTDNSPTLRAAAAPRTTGDA